MAAQVRELRHGAAFIIGTPGRVLDHVRRGTLKMDHIRTVVLDEGDHMLDMGFREELESILEAAPARERTWLFSATMPPAVRALSRRYLTDPEMISLVEEGAQHEDIVHRVYTTPRPQGGGPGERCSGRTRRRGSCSAIPGLRPSRWPTGSPGRVQFLLPPRRYEPEGEEPRPGDVRLGPGFPPGSHRRSRQGLDIPDVEHVFQFGLPPTQRPSCTAAEGPGGPATKARISWCSPWPRPTN